MKKLFLIIATSSVLFILKAQKQELLEVNYILNIDVNISNFAKQNGIDENDTSLINALLQEFTKPKKYKLDINKHESAYYEVFSLDNSQPKENGQPTVQLGTSTEKVIKYKNVETLEMLTESGSGFSKKYLIKDTLEVYPWRLKKELKNVAELPVRKATFFNENDSIEVTAWYAPKLNYKHGPEDYWGLPGLILELELSYIKSDAMWNKFTYTASNIAALEKEIKMKPTKGEIISSDDFWKMIREEQRKFDEMQSGGVDVSD